METYQRYNDTILNFMHTLSRWKFIRFFMLTSSLLLIIFGVFYTTYHDHLKQFVYMNAYKRQEIDLSIHTKLTDQMNGNDIISINHKIINKNNNVEHYGDKIKLHYRDNEEEVKLDIDETKVLYEDNDNEKVEHYVDKTKISYGDNNLKYGDKNYPHTLNYLDSYTSPNDALKTTKEDVEDDDDDYSKDGGSENKTKKDSLETNEFVTATTKILKENIEKSDNNADRDPITETPLTTTKVTTEQVASTKSPITEQTKETTTKMVDSQPETSMSLEDFDKLLNTKTSEVKQCKPAKSVVFLKTHKTGSSTVINIMQRFAHNNHLKVALPGVNHFLGWPSPFQEKFIFEHSGNETYDIFCNHARFHKQRIMNIMSSPDTKFITITRDPLYQFESTAVYLNFASLLKLNRSKEVLESFFEDRTPHQIYTRTKYRNTHNIYLLKNPIAYDLGAPSWKQTDADVSKFLTSIKRDFDLVMISDYMAESLIMLKDLLCWDMKDILYFTMNRRAKKYRPGIKNPDQTRKKVNNWNKLDATLFDNVNKTFWQNIQNGGQKFANEVQTLKSMNTKLSEICLETGIHRDKSQPWFPIEGFKLKPEVFNTPYQKICEDMTRAEIHYTNMLKLEVTKYNWTIPTEPPKRKKKSKRRT